MRKMKTPEMDVIRLNESDVIVASGGGTVPAGILRMSGFDNTTSGDGTYAFGTKTYTSGQVGDDFYSDLTQTFEQWNVINGDTGLTIPYGGSDLGTITWYDQEGWNAGGYDGDYTYSSGSGFVKQ